MIAAWFALLTACSGLEPADPEVAVAARVALAVRAGRTLDQALHDEGLTGHQLDALLFEIASNPAQSEAYVAGLRAP